METEWVIARLELYLCWLLCSSVRLRADNHGANHSELETPVPVLGHIAAWCRMVSDVLTPGEVGRC